ncbi:hypothetical protein H0A66_16635 [Alcaligenaceae bacterium]|nr:hypothetical protein [Alcaligenaceae bacterium]
MPAAILTRIWGRVWPYIAALGALIVAVIGIRQSGKAAARTQDAAKINKTQAKAAKEHRDVENTVAQMDDDTVDSRLDEWVREPKSRD